MNPNETPTSPEPPIPLSPEDDPRLEAIEALEARVVDPNPGPLDLDKPIPAPAPKPVVIAPVAVPPPQPVVVTASPVEPVKTVEVAAPPKIPKTPAAQMAEELATIPSTRPQYQFFLRQKASRKQIWITIAIVIGIIIGVGAYLGFKALQ